jgi:hypothetical protein
MTHKFSHRLRNATPMERYQAKIDKSGGPEACWPWTGWTNPRGYGQFSVEHRKTVVTHRWGYQQLIGPIPPGLLVLHTCDNPPCQNPAHWKLGTSQDNVDDRQARGRQVRGHQTGRSILTEDDVREIRRMMTEGWTQAQLARRFGVSNNSIHCIVTGKSWSWLT